MSLPIPNLDDRNFDDLMKEVRSIIPVYNKEWTNYNPSDPGITILEFFAWLMEMTIYRVNRVPEENYRTFLKLIGIELNTKGTGTISSEGLHVTGTGTTFDKELEIGDLISVSDRSLFTWNNIPGNDNGKLKDFIRQDFGLDWIEAAVIEKIDNNTIRASSGENSIFLKLDNEKTSVSLKINDHRKDELYVKIENGILNIYTCQTRIVTTIVSDIALIMNAAFDTDIPSGSEFNFSYGSIESGIGRGLKLLSQRYRAITSDDYEFLAVECMKSLQKDLEGRAICVNNRNLVSGSPEKEMPGHISIIVIPGCDRNSVYYENDLPTDLLKTEIKKYLDLRRIITTRVHVTGPDYYKIELIIWIALKENTKEEEIKTNVVKIIKKYFNPLSGGQDEMGWPLGRDVYRSEIYNLVESIQGVDHVVKVFRKIPGTNTVEIENTVKIEKYQLIRLDLDPKNVEVHND